MGTFGLFWQAGLQFCGSLLRNAHVGPKNLVSMFRFYDLSCQATHARLTCRKYNRLNSRPLQKKVQYQFPRKKRENEKRICLHDLFARVCNCTSTCTSANPCSKWPPTFAPALIISLRSSDSALSLDHFIALLPAHMHFNRAGYWPDYQNRFCPLCPQ